MRRALKQPETFLHPGELCFASAPGRLGTLLGSCVAVTLWHPGRRLGGLCHILLPGRQRRPPGSLPDARFADEAIELFSYELKSRQIEPAECQVKIFGGGNMFSGSVAGAMNVGKRNIAATRHALAAHGFTIVAENVGGTIRRRLFLDLTSGHVWMALPSDR